MARRGDARGGEIGTGPERRDASCANGHCACAGVELFDGYCGAYCRAAERSDPFPAACACEHEACARSVPVRTVAAEPARVAVGLASGSLPRRRRRPAGA